MFSKTVTFKNFLGKEITKTYHFHMSEFDIFSMDYNGESLTEERIKSIIKSDDNAAILRLFCFLLTSAVGIPDEEGNVFVKNQSIRDEFSNSNALPAVIYSLIDDDTTAFVSQLLGVEPEKIPKEENPLAKEWPVRSVAKPADYFLDEALDIIHKHPEFVLRHLGGGRYDVIDPLTNSRANV